MSEIEPFVRNTQYKEELAEKTHIKILDILIAISISIWILNIIKICSPLKMNFIFNYPNFINIYKKLLKI